MIAYRLLAATPMERFMGIRDRLLEGGRFGPFLLVLLALGFVLLLLPFLVERFARQRRRRALNNPKRLFLEVLRQLQLTVPQRELIRRIARDLRLAQPTVLLLCPQLFHQHANAWMSATRSAHPQMRARLESIARRLFGTKPLA